MMQGIRPENKLLICVARTRSLDSATAESLRELVRSDLDWEYLLAMAHRHCVIPLLNHHLNSICPDAVPPKVMARLKTENRENTRTSLFLTAELLKLLHLFSAHNIQAIPFKGPTLAFSAYGDLALRQFGDLDILVHKQDVLKVKRLLVGRGFRPTWELTKAQEAALLRHYCVYLFESNDNGISLDIQWGIVVPYFSFELDVSQLWDRVEPITIGGQRLLGLSPEDQLLILCMHGSKHLWERLSWISDIASLIECRKDIDWQLVLQNATALGSRRMLALGLFLASDLLGAPIPQGIRKMIQADPKVMTLAKQVQQRLFRQQDEAMGIEMALLHLRMRERKRDRLRYCLRSTLNITVSDLLLLPLPEWLFFLYYPLRPFRLAGKFGSQLLRGHQWRVSN